MLECAPQQVGFNLPFLFEINESEVFRRVQALSRSDLLLDKACLISRLVRDLTIVTPTVRWDLGEPKCGFESVFDPAAEELRWRVSCTFAIEDPTYILIHLNWLGSTDPRDYDPDPEGRRLKVAQTVAAKSEEEAIALFQISINALRAELERVAGELERFNQALPYLLSLQIAVRQDCVAAGWSLPTTLPVRHAH
jgi:hypothetical protein